MSIPRKVSRKAMIWTARIFNKIGSVFDACAEWILDKVDEFDASIDGPP